MDTPALNRMMQYIRPEVSGCTSWLRFKDKDGYPMFWWKGRTRRASRVLWEIIYGEIPAGFLVCHVCDNPECLTLAHLFIGTSKQNTGDALSKGRMVGPRKVSQEVMATIVNLAALGFPINYISNRLKLSVSTIYTYFPQHLKRQGKYNAAKR